MNSVRVRLNEPLGSSAKCLVSPCDDLDGKTWCHPTSYPQRGLLCTTHDGKEDLGMRLTDLDVSHELRPPKRPTFDEGVYAIVHTAVRRSSTWFELHCRKHGVRVDCAVP